MTTSLSANRVHQLEFLELSQSHRYRPRSGRNKNVTVFSIFQDHYSRGNAEESFGTNELELNAVDCLQYTLNEVRPSMRAKPQVGGGLALLRRDGLLRWKRVDKRFAEYPSKRG